ncbi:methyl-accepting chemotaxis protein [Marinospirillum perlucidum]|uniref:methyl-accepting chemotaxis protein n=1 Tax=Marinospirillum perlucidum TaxID=1982602 RepID=UPI000DF43392|nr:methyl-accepting chemotaxis protein [Marinospirillum perlucidum]
MKMNFQNKLLVSVATLLFVALILLGLLAGNLLQQEVTQAAASEVHKSLRSTKNLADKWLEAHSSLLTATAEELQSNRAGWEDALTLVRKAGGFQLVYVGTTSGAMVQSRPAVDLPPGFDARTRPWYQDAREAGELIITPPYVDAGSGELVMSMALPLATNGGHILAADLSIGDLVSELLGNSLRWTSQTWMLNEDQQLLAHPDTEQLNKNALEALQLEALPDQGELVPVTYEGKKWFASSIHLADAGWTFLLLVDAREAEAGLGALAWQVALFSILITAVSCLLLFWLIRWQLGPLQRLATALERISEGEADLTQRLEADNEDEFGRMSASFNRFVERLQKMVTQVVALTRQLDQDAEISQKQAQANLDELANQQMEITQLASAAHQMAQATSEIAGNAENTAGEAQTAAASTRDGLELVDSNRGATVELAEQLSQGMHSLSQVDERVQEITDILVTIQGIAEQTNLLALNAAIEAARAGDHGRGFAVVADEVRALSQRTQAATEEIRSMIDGLQASTEEAVGKMKRCQSQAQTSVEGSEQATERLQSIDQANTRISDMASQIASAVEEQNAVTTEISGNTEKIRLVSDELSEQAEASRQRSQDLRDRVVNLSELTGKFKI